VQVTAAGQPTIEALDACFQERRRQVPLLAQRAEAERIEAIRHFEDMVPLLLPHTTYKSYPDTLITKGRWAGLNRWLDSLSTQRVDVDVSDVADVDGWIRRLEQAGHVVSSSSGTTGKFSFINKTRRDQDTFVQYLLDSFSTIGVVPEPVWNVVTVIPTMFTPRGYNSTRDALIRSFSRPDPAPILVEKTTAVMDHHRYMSRLVAMRRAMAEGTAEPDDVAEFEAEAARRQREVETWRHQLAEQLVERRHERMLFGGMYAQLFQFCDVLREHGVTEGDFTGENVLNTGGGLKGTTLPPDHRKQVAEMLNISPARLVHHYTMQELNVRCLKCAEGRYHVPAEAALFVLDRGGEALAPVSDGQVEGRAAFFDTTIEGRWGGIISGDKIHASLDDCPCGKPGPSIFDDISRFSELPDGDKITCAGTVDAYVRGFIDA
jgi:hypothetical protein